MLWDAENNVFFVNYIFVLHLPCHLYFCKKRTLPGHIIWGMDRNLMLMIYEEY